MGKDLQNLAPHFVEILSGDEKGRRIELGERLTIGRSDGSDIVVKSDGVSRNHALILSGEDGLKIQDTGSKNGILVNGSRQTEVVLRSGDIFQVGESVFRVGSSIQPQSQDVSHREEEDGNNSVEGHSEELAEPVQPIPQLEAPMATPRFSGASKRVPLYLGLAIFVGFAYWFANEGSLETPARKGASSSSPATSDDSRIAVLETNTEQGGSEQGETATAKALVAKPPTTLSPEMKWSEENSSKLDWSDSGLREAEQYFRKGARELSNQNYHRAIDSFQMALQIDKSHSGAQKYLGWAVQEAELEAKKNRDIAIRYYESLQYQRAIYYFETVIALMAHKPLDPMVGQSEKYIDYSKRALEAADFFP